MCNKSDYYSFITNITFIDRFYSLLETGDEASDITVIDRLLSYLHTESQSDLDITWEEASWFCKQHNSTLLTLADADEEKTHLIIAH